MDKGINNIENPDLDFDDIMEAEWLSAIMKSNPYDNLKHSDEDIYSVNDGQPVKENL